MRRKISQAFLSSLKGIPPAVAEKAVRGKKFEPMLVDENVMAVSAVARPDTVILWQRAGVIERASVGDPAQLR
jgi:hypothetical protein